MLRNIKIFLAFSMFLWALIGGVVNLLEYNEHVKQVGFIMSMQGIPVPNAANYRAIMNPMLITLAFSFIYLSKFLAAYFFFTGFIAMFKAKQINSTEFKQAKNNIMTGCGILVAMLFLGFITIGGLYFNMWQAGQMGVMAHDFAFIYLVSIVLVTGFILLPDDQFNEAIS